MKIDAQAQMLAAQALQNRGTANYGNKDQMVAKAKEFEAIFVQQVFKTMRQTIPESGLLPRGQATEMFEEMQDIEAAKQVTSQRGIGLAEMLIEQLQKNNLKQD